jgi:predicted PurR-regulated permease PerM
MAKAIASSNRFTDGPKPPKVSRSRLAIWCAIGVVGVEHLAKPFILRATSGGEMHTGLMFLALLGGLEVFGILGVILGPLIVSFFISLTRVIERNARAAALQ